MSPNGTFATSRERQAMCAFGPKADARYERWRSGARSGGCGHQVLTSSGAPYLSDSGRIRRMPARERNDATTPRSVCLRRASAAMRIEELLLSYMTDRPRCGNDLALARCPPGNADRTKAPQQRRHRGPDAGEGRGIPAAASQRMEPRRRLPLPLQLLQVHPDVKPS